MTACIANSLSLTLVKLLSREPKFILSFIKLFNSHTHNISLSSESNTYTLSDYPLYNLFYISSYTTF